MMDYSTGRPSGMMSFQELQELRSDVGFQRPGGIFTTGVLPGLGEVYAERLMGHTGVGGSPGWIERKLGRKLFGESLLGRKATPWELKQATRGKLFPTLNASTGLMSTTQSKALVKATNLRSISRSIGMAELIGIGADLTAAGINAVTNYKPASNEIKYETGPGFFHDTRAARTQRQRAIQAIHNSQLTTRAALGNEAAFLHI